VHVSKVVAQGLYNTMEHLDGRACRHEEREFLG
jgi:hypothetical protein